MKMWGMTIVALVCGAVLDGYVLKPSAAVTEARPLPQFSSSCCARPFDTQVRLAMYEGEESAPPRRLDEPPPQLSEPTRDSDIEPAAVPESAKHAAVREVIERALSDASPEERQIWFDELKGLPPGVVEDLLHVRRHFGAPDTKTLSTFAPPVTSQQKPKGATNGRWTAARAALQRARDVHLHNLANAQTLGYQRVVPLLTPMPGPTAESSVPSGCEWAGTRVDDQPGPTIETRRPLDVAIQGEGWFAVRSADDRLHLTRNGHITINANGELCVPALGEPLPLDPSVRVPDSVKDLRIVKDGSVFDAAGARMEPIGRIQLVLSVGGEESALSREIGMKRAAPGENGAGLLMPQALEASNVNADAEWREIERIERWLKATE